MAGRARPFHRHRGDAARRLRHQRLVRVRLGHDPNSPAELGHVPTRGNLRHLRNLRLISVRWTWCLGVLVVDLQAPVGFGGRLTFQRLKISAIIAAASRATFSSCSFGARSSTFAFHSGESVPCSYAICISSLIHR